MAKAEEKTVIYKSAWWKRVPKPRRMTEEEIYAAALSDPDAQPLTEAELKRMKRVAPIKRLRWKLGLSQEKFAERYRIPIGTLRDWEQRCYEPQGIAETYVQLIAANPASTARMLKRGAEEAATGGERKNVQ